LIAVECDRQESATPEQRAVCQNTDCNAFRSLPSETYCLFSNFVLYWPWSEQEVTLNKAVVSGVLASAMALTLLFAGIAKLAYFPQAESLIMKTMAAPESVAALLARAVVFAELATAVALLWPLLRIHFYPGRTR
jgi:hypothetical protein